MQIRLYRNALLLSLLWVAPMMAEVMYRANDAKPLVVLPSANQAADEIRFELNLPTLDRTDQCLAPFGKGSAIALDYGYPAVPAPGMPNVAGMKCMVQIPDTGAVDVVVDRYESRVLDNVTVAPAQHPKLIGYDQPLPYVINQAVYAQNAFYPSSLVSSVSCEILRELRVAVITFHPVRYNPVSHQMELITKAWVSVKPRRQAPGENELQLADRALSPNFMPQYEQVLNFDMTRQSAVRTTPGCYLFIGSAANLEAIKELVDWKKQKGYVVKTAIPGQDEVPTTVEGLDKWIETAYKTWNPKPEYILLVGGENVIPSKMMSGMMNHRFPSDNVYAVIGTGSNPSISLGRITGNRRANDDDPAILRYVAHKIVRHDKTPPEGDFNGKWLAYGCHSQQPGDGIGLNIQKEWLGYAETGVASVIKGTDKATEEGGPVMNSAQFMEHINKGVSLVTYIGHGSTSTWGNLKFDDKKADRLANETVQPVIFSLACLSGCWTNTYCLYEHFMDQGNIEHPKGAVAVYGYSTYSGENVGGIISHALQNYFQKKIYRLGPALLDTRKHASDPNDAKSGTLFGCPEIDLITGPLQPLSATCGDIQDGPCTVQVTANGSDVTGALVSVVDSDLTLLGSAFADATGQATLTLQGVKPGTDVTLTVTGHNGKPFITSLKAKA